MFEFGELFMNFTVYTIGHSTRAIEEFLAVLKQYEIKEVIDIRTIPKSQHNPQFNGDELKKALHNHHIGYRHMKGLGGLRHPKKDSINTAWRNSSFRGYADYMQTAEFAESLEQLIEIASKKQTVIMCAEALPWRCHRSLIGDALLVRHIMVIDIMNEKTSRPHTLTPWSYVDGLRITYPLNED